MYTGCLSILLLKIFRPFRKAFQLIHSFIQPIFLLMVFQVSSYHFAQNNEIRFDNISLEDGLSQSTVYSIAQDSIGFMWFSTKDGLNKYDGKYFTVYRPDPANSNSISELGIRQLQVDDSGNLWIVTLNGLLDRFNPVTGKFYHYKLNYEGFKLEFDNRIRCVVKDISGNIWVGTSAGLLFKYNKLKDIFIHQPYKVKLLNEFPDIHLQCMYADKRGFLWMGAWEGLIRYDTKLNEADRFMHNPADSYSLSGNAVFGITGDSEGNIWIATADGSICVFNYRTQKFKTYAHDPNDKNSTGSNRTMSVFADSRNNIWIGTVDAGLDIYNPKEKKFNHYRYNSALPWSLANGGVRSFFEDKKGSIWIGTSSGGVSCVDWDRQHFVSIIHTNDRSGSLSNNNVLSVLEDRTGKIWIGTDGGGLNYGLCDENDFNHYFLNSTADISNSITALYESRDGTIWVGADPGTGTSAGTVMKYNRNTKQFIPQKKLSPSVAGIAFFYEDKDGELWIGNYFDGLRRYNQSNHKVTLYQHNESNNKSISENSVISVFEDRRGFLWFGTYGSGLNRFNKTNEQFERFSTIAGNSESLNNNSVWSIYEDEKDNLWIGTWGGGLNQFVRSTNKFRNFTVKDGLPSNVIYGILPDKRGNIWLSTNHGLCKFNLKTFECTNYDYADGLLNTEFSQKAYYSGTNGRFYFGGTNGLTVFFPDSIKENSHLPPIVLTDFSVFDKPLELDRPVNSIKEITLSYSQNFFSFKFASLGFTAPDKNQYKYILEGLDKNWVYAGNRNYASYTDVPPGKYVFKVTGSNTDGIWSELAASVTVFINPPFWKTWWFRILAFIVLALILYSLHKYRLNRLLEVERTRNRIARDLHDEVSASITGIVYFADAIKTEVKEKETPALKKLIGLISESATQIQESMSDIIWSINPDNDDWDVVLPKFRRYASDLCESKGIKYQIEIPESFSGKSLKMEQRHDFWLIFKEIITNAVRHSFCGQIEIKLFTDSEYLNLQITDDGIGFDCEVPNANNGVKNIKARTKTLGGYSDLITSKGNGTQWIIKIPLSKTKK